MRLPQSVDWKNNSYDLIIIIINLLIKMIYYKLVYITITESLLVNIILNTVV